METNKQPTNKTTHKQKTKKKTPKQTNRPLSVREPFRHSPQYSGHSWAVREELQTLISRRSTQSFLSSHRSGASVVTAIVGLVVYVGSTGSVVFAFSLEFVDSVVVVYVQDGVVEPSTHGWHVDKHVYFGVQKSTDFLFILISYFTPH